MRVVLDECLPRRLKLELIGHEVTTVQESGWAGKSNGALLALIAVRFDAFITVDQNLPAQQKIAELSFGVVVLRARSNQLGDLRPLVPEMLKALVSLRAGAVVIISAEN
jgi:hypothetical protein